MTNEFCLQIPTYQPTAGDVCVAADPGGGAECRQCSDKLGLFRRPAAQWAEGIPCDKQFSLIRASSSPRLSPSQSRSTATRPYAAVFNI